MLHLIIVIEESMEWDLLEEWVSETMIILFLHNDFYHYQQDVIISKRTNK